MSAHKHVVRFTKVEEVTSRANFKLDGELSALTFKGLVGPYDLNRSVSCRFVRTGKICDQAHRNGWLAVNLDLEEVFLGIDCADNYLAASEIYGTEKNRINIELRWADLEASLTSKILAREETLEKIASLRARLTQIANAQYDWQQRLGAGATRRIRGMLKIGRSVVDVEVRHDEVDDDGKIKYRWIPESLGSIVGIAAFQDLTSTQIRERLGAANDAATVAQFGRLLKYREMKAWDAALATVPSIEREIEELEASMIAFEEASNIQLTLHLIRNDTERFRLWQWMLSRRGQGNLIEIMQRKALRDFDAQLRKDRFGGRDFRPAGAT